MTRVLAGSIALALLAGCGGKEKSDLDSIDQRLGANADPEIMAAVNDQLMVDPALSQQANEHAVRPPTRPMQSPIPPDPVLGGQPPVAPANTLGQLAAFSANQFRGCQLDVGYAMEFSTRLPAELPIHPRGRLTEAAGSDNAGCRLRAVSYEAPETPESLAGYYLALAKRGGYRAELKRGTGETLVTGARGDGAAFYAVIRPRGAGASADLVANHGS